MNIWPWSRIKELEAERNKWLQSYMDIYASRQRLLKYLDSVEPGRHICVADKMYIFTPESTWVAVVPDNGQVDAVAC